MRGACVAKRDEASARREAQWVAGAAQTPHLHGTMHCHCVTALTSLLLLSQEWVNATLAEKFYFGATPMAQQAGFFKVMGQTNYDEYDW